MEEGRLPKEVMKWSLPGRRKRGRPKLTWAEGIRGLMREKGLTEEDWNDKRQLEEEDNIIVNWAQEDAETLYSLLNNKTSTSATTELVKLLAASASSLCPSSQLKLYFWIHNYSLLSYQF